MKGARTAFGILVTVVGAATLLYIAWQYLSGGREAARMAGVLAAEASAFRPPPAAILVTRDVAWEPGRAHVTEYYNTSLPLDTVRDYYSTQLRSLGWSSGPLTSTRSLAEVALVYHKADREFRVSFGSPTSGWTYETSLMWGH